MIQRFLYTTLKDGLEEIQNNLDILDDLFHDLYRLEQSEVDDIKTAFTAKPPGVIHGYARSETDFPVFSIVLVSEQEDEHYMGDDAGMIDEPGDPDFGSDRISTIWAHDYSILCYTEHPDLTLYYYEMAKAIFMTADLNALDLFNVHVSGRDLMPDPQYIPEHLFVRQLSFRASREFERIDANSKLGRAWRVRGVHIDKSGSPSDVGNVKTLVDPTSILAELREES
jgi:hypothetical protein